jgi:hypothetical protein
MITDGVGKALRLANRRIPGPERRKHALAYPYSPATVLFDNIESDHF